ncbi:MAG: 16S rRNA (cytidine(1402)-2'-O)-methyltransferase [Candidatus Yonathbacteria bacterium]|nr:16S rRNA (cytidine(1402)-2'-O)-methyltransferase [Candidatus Yonathbacteria bacterium]NTW47717.1 16S rRNA (cytidine(1402)-2'-O)-methyltransferase [Candidatus Yonathbacteria bacterium]
MATLSIVATPIGNLEDITLRAIRVLKEADIVLCEDTRVTKHLLDKYDIATPTMRYDAHSTPTQQERIFSLLDEGKHVALVSDAGTPGISDPGTHLVGLVRKRLGEEVTIEAIPGPSALTAALSISGLSLASFIFLGFLPQKKGRQTLFTEIARSERAVVLYESPHRIIKTLETFAEMMPERTVAIGRELTKIHEEFVSGSADELLAYFIAHPDKVRGEFVVIVGGL